MSKFDIKNFVNPHITTLEDFNSQYKESIHNPSSFFLKKAISYISWFKEPNIGHNGNFEEPKWFEDGILNICLLYTSPSPRDRTRSRMPSSA